MQTNTKKMHKGLQAISEYFINSHQLNTLQLLIQIKQASLKTLADGLKKEPT